MTDLLDFRRSLGRFATGVTIICCRDGDGRALGITANSFSSVSLDPPLILWNIAKVSRSLDAYINAEYFGVNVLAAGQEDLSVRFARSDVDPFAGLDHDESERQVPRIEGCIAWFECRTHAVHDSGDHYIIVGEVIDYAAAEGEPLLFFRGNYRALD